MSHTILPPSLTVEVTGSVAILRLARAEKRNAQDDVTVEGLGRFFAQLPAGVGAVVIAGNGPHFCAGLDLGEALGNESLGEAILHSQTWHRAFNEIQFGRVPVVSVLHGAVVGGGLELAAAPNRRVAEPSAYYGLPEGQRGIFLGGGSVRIPRLIGLQRVQDMMFTGRTLSADEGHAAGISQYLVPEGQGLAKGLELARKIATNAPMSNFAIMQCPAAHRRRRRGNGLSHRGGCCSVDARGQKAAQGFPRKAGD
jgi:(methylthio)acryloyl-CoA hydratase